MYSQVRLRIIYNNYDNITVHYFPFHDYGFNELIENIKFYCQQLS